MTQKHVPVMLTDVMTALGDIHGARVLDATFGAGGYTSAFLDAGASVVAFDRDPNVANDAMALQKQFADRFTFIARPFSAMSELNEKFDAIVFDLGISSMQIDNPERGFSFRADAPLDMRMSKDGPTLAQMFDKWTAEDMVKILRDYGDVTPATAIARAIKDTRPQTTFELKDLVHNPRDIAPVFQAFRIAINDEMGELNRALDAVPNLLNVGGRCVCVTFHSIEDRIVKNYFRNLGKKCVCPPEVAQCRCGGKQCAELLTRKPVGPTAEEVKDNSPSRSAKLRVIRKLCNATEYHLEGVVGF